MRWLYWDPTVEKDVSYRQQMLAKIDIWWAAFLDNQSKIAAALQGNLEWDLVAWMQRNLAELHPGLLWEFGPGSDGQGRRLVITPERNRCLRPLLDTAIQKAPAIDGWEFFQYRQATRDAAQLDEAVSPRCKVTADSLLVTCGVSQLGRVDLTYYCDDFNRLADHPDDLAAALVATESSLGEEMLDNAIGELHTAAVSETGVIGRLFGASSGAPKDAVPVYELRDRVVELTEQLRSRLPDRPYFEFIDECQWGTFRLQPVEPDDDTGRSDLLIGVTGAIELWQVAHSSFIFRSRDHSRHGEVFCYLKIATPEGPTEANGQTRGELEDQLTETLVAEKLGCAFGGGAGLRHAYVDLALLDIKAALPVIRRVLESKGVSSRCWLMFFDDALAWEWLGVFDNTQAPKLCDLEI